MLDNISVMDNQKQIYDLIAPSTMTYTEYISYIAANPAELSTVRCLNFLAAALSVGGVVGQAAIATIERLTGRKPETLSDVVNIINGLPGNIKPTVII